MSHRVGTKAWRRARNAERRAIRRARVLADFDEITRTAYLAPITAWLTAPSLLDVCNRRLAERSRA